jgi:hypothetical protein
VVVASESELPGFLLYAVDGRAIERTTFEEERFSLVELRGELPALLDAGNLARRVFDAKLEPKRDAATGEITFSGKVDRDIVPATGGEMAFLTQGRVLETRATLVLHADGRLKSVAVRVTRSDPMREMMRGGVRQIVIAGGAPPGALPPADDDRKHEIAGGSTTYTLSFREGGPSARAKAFQEEMERLLRPVDHGDPLPPGDQGEQQPAPDER